MIKRPRGTEDLYSKKSKLFAVLETILRNTMDLYNFEEIRTPSFESIDLFKRGVGEDTDVVSKEMFNFLDKKNREFALKPEGTASVVRAYIENKIYSNDLKVNKLFYIDKMYRYERPQAGRQREFNQFGCEAIGLKNPMIDAELISVASNVLKNLNLNNFTLNLNYLVIGKQREEYVVALKKYLSSKSLCDDCDNRINKNPLRVLDCKIDEKKFDDIISMNDFLSKDEKEYFIEVQKILKLLDIPFNLKPKLVRGLDYYNGIVFEFVSNNKDQGSQATLIGGGRYDNLIKDLDGPDKPAIGFAMGIERIVIALENEKVQIVNDKEIDAFIIPLSPKANNFSMILSQMLRTIGVSCDIAWENKNIKTGFNQAEKFNCSNIILIGEQELKENCLIIKNQKNKKEVKVSFENISDYFKGDK